MASLTKVVALTTVAMFAVEERKLDLDAPVVHYLPEFARGTGREDPRHGARPAPARQRPSSRSGAAAVEGLAQPGCRGRAGRSASNLDTVPGARYVYSDLSAITLAAILERLYHKRLDRPLRGRSRAAAWSHPDALPAAAKLAKRNRADRDRVGAISRTGRAARRGARRKCLVAGRRLGPRRPLRRCRRPAAVRRMGAGRIPRTKVERPTAAARRNSQPGRSGRISRTGLHAPSAGTRLQACRRRAITCRQGASVIPASPARRSGSTRPATSSSCC